MANSKRNKQRVRRAQAREVARTRRHKARVRWVSVVLVVVLSTGVVGFALAFALTGDTNEETAGTTTTAPVESPCPRVDNPPAREVSLPAPSFESDPQIDPAKKYTATMETSCGDMVFDLDAAGTPVDVNNFVYLARQGFYDNIVFHRVINGFVIQAGDPGASDPESPGSEAPGYRYQGATPTAPTDGSNTYGFGDLAMANTNDPSSNGSQFFIVSGPEGEALPPNYSLFGRLTEGGEVVEKIQTVPTVDSGGYPVEPVVIEKVTISES